MNKLFRRLIIYVITFSIFVTSVPCISVYASNADDAYFQMYVFSDSAKRNLVGHFMAQNGRIYISDESLKHICNFEQTLIIGIGDEPWEFMRGSISGNLGENDIIQGTDDNYYYDMEKVFDALALDASFSPEEHTLIVVECDDVRKLEPIIADVYKNNLYNMGYWQNSKMYGVDEFCAVVTDIVTNLSFSGYVTGDKYDDIYQEAMWDIMLPTNEDERIEEARSASKAVKTVAKYRKYCDKWSEALGEGKDSGFLGDLGSVFLAMDKANELLNYSGMLDAIEYIWNVKNIEESYFNGLNLLLENNNQYISSWYKAAEYVQYVHDSNMPIWEAVALEFAEGVSDRMIKNKEEKLLEDFWLKEVAGVKVLPCKIAKTTIDLIWNTQGKVDATMKAQACLDIQNKCEEYKRRHWMSWGIDKLTQDKLDDIRNLRDITALYLQCGYSAYKSVELDDELKAASEYSCNEIETQLLKLLDYKTVSFTYIKDNAKANASVLDYSKTEDSKEILIEEVSSDNLLIEWDDFQNLNYGFQIVIQTECDEGILSSTISCGENGKFSCDDEGRTYMTLYDYSTPGKGKLNIDFTPGFKPVTIVAGGDIYKYAERDGFIMYMPADNLVFTVTSSDGEIIKSPEIMEYVTRWGTGYYEYRAKINWALGCTQFYVDEAYASEDIQNLEPIDTGNRLHISVGGIDMVIPSKVSEWEQKGFKVSLDEEDLVYNNPDFKTRMKKGYIYVPGILGDNIPIKTKVAYLDGIEPTVVYIGYSSGLGGYNGDVGCIRYMENIDSKNLPDISWGNGLIRMGDNYAFWSNENLYGERLHTASYDKTGSMIVDGSAGDSDRWYSVFTYNTHEYYTTGDYTIRFTTLDNDYNKLVDFETEYQIWE